MADASPPPCTAPCRCWPPCHEPRWTAAEIERAGRHLGATSRLVALAITDVLREPPAEWRR